MTANFPQRLGNTDGSDVSSACVIEHIGRNSRYGHTVDGHRDADVLDSIVTADDGTRSRVEIDIAASVSQGIGNHRIRYSEFHRVTHRGIVLRRCRHPHDTGGNALQRHRAAV